MKKLAGFIVHKKYYILAVVLLLCIGCAFLLPHVEINRDLTVYLPDDSDVRAGLSVMQTEFPGDMPNGSIRIMFEKLPDDRIPEVREKLEALPHISRVDYEDTEKYHKDPYVLFVAACDFAYNTPEEKAAESDIADLAATFEHESVTIQHEAATISEIPAFVYLIVMVVLLVILFIMCGSYVEPFLFLITIGIAILINSGTNAFFPSVSETTYTLSAILQLALSMDYSVILMNRYRQGRATAENPDIAMQNAFREAFPSILSSGLTTVVGLIMLVFMRFKIGLDLGRVLAKGVALSMICVLFILPPLILIFEKAIAKTAKKEPSLPTRLFASLGYRGRRIVAALFAVLFIGTAFLQGMTNLTFNQPKNNTIEKVFPSVNPIVLLYRNQDADKIASLIPDMEKEEQVDAVLGYVNTVGKPLTAEEMTAAIAAMTSGQMPMATASWKSTPGQADMQAFLNPSVVRLLYYQYAHRGEAEPPMSVHTFMQFLTDTVLKDDRLSGLIDTETKDQITAMSGFTDPAVLTKPLTSAELAAVTKQDEGLIRLLLSSSFAASPDYTPDPMTISELVRFIQEDVAENPLFGGQFDEATLAQLHAIAPFVDRTVIGTPLPAAGLAKAFGLDVSVVEKILLLKCGPSENPTMSMADFVSFLLSDIVKNPLFEGAFDPETVAQLTMTNVIMQSVMQEKTVGYTEAAAFLSMPPETLKLLYTYHVAVTQPSALTLSLQSLVSMLATQPGAGESMKPIRIFVDTIVSDQPLTPQEMYALLSGIGGTDTLTENQLRLLFLFRASMTDGDERQTMTMHEFLHDLSTHVADDPLFAPFLTPEIKNTLSQADTALNGIVKRLKGEEHAILLLSTSLPAESPETSRFVHTLQNTCRDHLSGEFFIIGNSPMNVEMEDHFHLDMLLITLLTAFAIFLIVALTFRSFSIPLILVLLVQCGVFITSTINGLMGHDIYYLALLIVQCILMGSTIDYGIVFTNYYLENRRKYGIREALVHTFRQSIHTILTSGLIIVLITGIIGFSPADPAITEICQTLSIGALTAILLILLILPGLLATFDRFVTKSRKKGSEIAPAAGFPAVTDPADSATDGHTPSSPDAGEQPEKADDPSPDGNPSSSQATNGQGKSRK